jgi:cellulose-binding protein
MRSRGKHSCHFFGATVALATLTALHPLRLRADDARSAQPPPPLRVMIETDAGGDPDDEQSLVRFLLYGNEWDVEGIIATRAAARDGENLNPQRTGLGIVTAMLDAYAQCHANLVKHDPRYPDPGRLRRVTVAGYADRRDGVDLIRAAVDRDDPRPLWFCNWGTDDGSGPSNLRRALNEVLRERGPAGYAKFKNRLRLSSDDKFAGHTTSIDPPFPLWVDTFHPEVDRKRWYHRFSAITATAGGFDVERDVRHGHGPLGALYPTNTTHPQKEGDSMTFLYLVPTGMNDVDEPTWGSWAGRYGLNPAFPKRRYYRADQQDTWRGSTSRDNTLARWAEHLQNDFRARLDWCVNDYAHGNHPPVVRVAGPPARAAKGGDVLLLDASQTSDPDRNGLRFDWSWYPEPGSYRGPPVEIRDATSAKATLVVPRSPAGGTVHMILTVTDDGTPPLTRYARVVVTVAPAGAG